MGFLAFLFGGKGKCPKCGAEVSPTYNFCPVCREPSTMRRILCPSCGQTLRVDTRFCPYCRAEIRPEIAEVEAVSIVWKKRPDEFAVKFELEDLAQTFRYGFIVEYGTLALLIVDGKLNQILRPGRYVETIKEKQKAGDVEIRTVEGVRVKELVDLHHVVVVIVHSADVQNEFEFLKDEAKLVTKDNFYLDRVKCTTVTRLVSPENFYLNLMLGRDVYKFGDLEEQIRDELRDALSEYVRSYEVEGLSSDLKVKESLEVSIQRHMNKSFSRYGLELIQMRVFVPEQEEIEKLRRRRKEEVELVRKEVELTRKRTEVLDAMRKAEIEEIKSLDEFEKFFYERDKDRVISKEDMEKLRQAFAEGRGDIRLAMKSFKERAEIMYDIEVRRYKLLEGGKLTLDEINLQTEISKAEAEGKIATMKIEELGKKEIEYQARLKDLEYEREKAKTEAEKKRLEFEIEKQKKEFEIAQVEKLTAIQNQRKWEKTKMELEIMEKLSKMTPEQAEMYLASDPTRAAVLMERARAMSGKLREEWVNELKRAYEIGMAGMKEVAIAASTGRGATMKDMAELVDIGRKAATKGKGESKKIVCKKCKHENELGHEFCSNCGEELR